MDCRTVKINFAVCLNIVGCSGHVKTAGPHEATSFHLIKNEHINYWPAASSRPNMNNLCTGISETI